ncbi:unnamed protein product, partial [Oncorhynchus mykiss]
RRLSLWCSLLLCGVVSSIQTALSAIAIEPGDDVINGVVFILMQSKYVEVYSWIVWLAGSAMFDQSFLYLDVYYTGGDSHIHRGPSSSELATLFRVEELFSALHHSEKCQCKVVPIGSPKLFCANEYDYVLMVRIMAARDQGSHAEVEVKVKKVLYHGSQVNIKKGHITLYPESWTTRGCTCPLLNPGELLRFGQATGPRLLLAPIVIFSDVSGCIPAL